MADRPRLETAMFWLAMTAALGVLAALAYGAKDIGADVARPSWLEARWQDYWLAVFLILASGALAAFVIACVLAFQGRATEHEVTERARNKAIRGEKLSYRERKIMDGRDPELLPPEVEQDEPLPLSVRLPYGPTFTNPAEVAACTLHECRFTNRSKTDGVSLGVVLVAKGIGKATATKLKADGEQSAAVQATLTTFLFHPPDVGSNEHGYLRLDDLNIASQESRHGKLVFVSPVFKMFGIPWDDLRDKLEKATWSLSITDYVSGQKITMLVPGDYP